MPSYKNLYIEQDNFEVLVNNIGVKEWEDFNSNDLVIAGNHAGCVFSAEGKEAKIDVYFKNDGTTTIMPVGNNTELSIKLCELIVGSSFQNKHTNAMCSFDNVSNADYGKLMDYLKSIDKIQVVSERYIENPAQLQIKLKSNFGDTITISYYDNQKLLLQGNPAYLFTEILYYMSLSDDITIDDIIQKQNQAYETKITVSETRKELKSKIPHIYDKLDDTILKLLSPAISLYKSNIKETP